jgi:DNA helicase HerA-like ATPase
VAPKKKADVAPFEARMGDAYKTDGGFVELGRAVKDDTVYPSVVVGLPTAMCNRHGLIAGATGTGKTKTLQLMAEQLAAQGVPVFAADMKGDLSGLMRAGDQTDAVKTRAADLGIEWNPQPSPVTFLALGGIGAGVPVRATVSSFGPQLLGKVLGANQTQTSSLNLVFRYADEKGLGLLDLNDLRAVLQYLTGEDGKAELATIGGLASSTAGVLLRSIVELEDQGAEAFFGEPQFDVNDLLRTTTDGRGVISCLELPGVQDRPKLFSTFLLWLLAELFHELPEVGDLDKPKLVFFFDEAHLLFEDASKEFVDQVAQTVRLIRSKGIGVFFITQLPDDVPDDVLAQLGNRVQHALRAFTPRDAKALKAAVTTYPKTDDYDLEEDLTRLGIGEAVVTTLTARGTPTPVVWTRMIPPKSYMGAVDNAEIEKASKADSIWSSYAEEIDRESARELLAKKISAAADADIEVTIPKPATEKPERSAGKKKKSDGVVEGYLKSQEGRRMINRVARGVFGLLTKGK